MSTTDIRAEAIDEAVKDMRRGRRAIHQAGWADDLTAAGLDMAGEVAPLVWTGDTLNVEWVDEAGTRFSVRAAEVVPAEHRARAEELEQQLTAQ